VEVYSGNAFIWAEWVCAVLGGLRKPYILTLHGGGLPAFTEKHPKRVERLLSGAAQITTPSHYIQDSLSALYSAIQYLPNALDIARYEFRLRSNPAPRLIWLRGLHAIYAPQVAIEVAGLLRNEYPDMRLTMAGPDKKDGSFEAARRQSDELGLSARIDFTGPIPKADVPVKLSDHDIFLNTTRYESFGVAVMEAAATGLCIVSTSVGELPYLWRDGQDALLAPQDDAHALAAAVRRVLHEPSLAASLSQAARRKAEQYDWSLILPRWEDLFRQVINHA
jgi:glycosyltransferase involved in cell wall biosynthesis